ncbi:hypothetical protein N7449_004754 [Penicillium cf. viridicatum]|uniref:Uncharacterized protein n=1 Tax=Penicillium cf. viridicatum TaxID=2972119 RepID=A0A9W9MK43_9EURO|nr:hypothetical protein N7449_004754 [Penicillium cf. viridicatum]
MVDIFESAKTTMSTVGNLAIACSLAELDSLYVSANDRDVPVLTLRLTDTQLRVLNITGAISWRLVIADSSVSSRVSARTALSLRF